MNKDDRELMDRVDTRLFELTKAITALAERTEKRLAILEEAEYVPVNLEQEIMTHIKNSLTKTFNDSLGGYNSAFQKLVNKVVEDHANSIKAQISEALKTALLKLSLRTETLVAVCEKKLARILISFSEGSIEKAVSQLKTDQPFKIRIAAMVAKILEEGLDKYEEHTK